MKKQLPLILLLTVTSMGAYGNFQSGFFNQGLSDGFWRDFNQQFQTLNTEINRLQRSSNGFQSQSKQYFDNNSHSYVIEVKISGLTKEDLAITVHQNQLMITGKRQIEETSDNRNSSVSTRFSQTVSIPSDGDQDHISAAFKDGVLKVSVPKLAQPKASTKKIPIQ